MPRNRCNERSKRLITETYKSLKKKIKDIRRWKDILCSLISRINLVMTATLQKTVCMLNAMLIKISMMFFTKIKKQLKLI
jgi:REP element-mobilizing transposase RayT